MSGHPEQAIQRAVVDHLTARPMRNLFAFHVPNGGWRSPIEVAILKSVGVIFGVPDLVLIRDGAFFGLELRAPDGRLGRAQIAAQKTMRGAGAIGKHCTAGRTMRCTAIAKSRQLDCASTARRRAAVVRSGGRCPTTSLQAAVAWRRPTALRQDKRREVRGSRTVEEWKRINHFARGAFQPCTSSLRTNHRKTEKTRTSRAEARRTWAAHRSVAPRTFRPFCPGRALWHIAAMACPRSWMRA